MMYGVYYINNGDAEWKLFSTSPTIGGAEKLMIGVKRYITKNWSRPPECVAISEGNDELRIERNELRSSS
jgi:hypothetical protein